MASLSIATHCISSRLLNLLERERHPMPNSNQLLAEIWEESHQALLADFRLASHQRDHVLYEASSIIEYSYFPINCLVDCRRHAQWQNDRGGNY